MDKNIRIIKGKTLIQYIPLTLIVSYLLITIFLFIFGPWDWPVENKLKLYVFFILLVISIIIGYKIGSNSCAKYRGKVTNRQLNVFLLLYGIFLPLTSLSRIKSVFPSFNMSKLISNLGASYYENNLINNNVMIEYLRILFAPILIAAPILLITSRMKNKKIKVLLLVLLGISYVFIDINRGQNRQIADYFLIILIAILINKVRNKIDIISKKDFKVSKRSIQFIGLGILFAVFINIFGTSMEQRNSSIYDPYANIYLDLNNVTLMLFPTDFLKITIGKLIAYLTQGYYGLSLAMNGQFDWSMGFGYSPFLMNNIEELFNVELLSRTYYAKTVAYGWPTGVKWSSAFVYFASDLTFLGTIVLFGVMAYALAKTWKESVINKNQISTIFFYLLIIIFIYAPANNQMFQLGENFIAFWTWFLVWLLYPRMLKIASKTNCNLN
jgi:hypothetical protein